MTRYLSLMATLGLLLGACAQAGGEEAHPPSPQLVHAAADHPPVALRQPPATTTTTTTTTLPPPPPTTTTAPPPPPTTVPPPPPEPEPQAEPAGDVPATLARIRGCESGSGPNSPGDYSARNPSSSASGAYQFIDSTWRAYRGGSSAARAYQASRAEQDAAAVRLYNAEGTSPWNASRSCWA